MIVMKVHAVIDTNVLISSLITTNFESPTISIIREITKGNIVPIYSDYLMTEYREVLSRSKFKIPDEILERVLKMFIENGLKFEPTDEFVT